MTKDNPLVMLVVIVVGIILAVLILACFCCPLGGNSGVYSGY